MLRGGLQHNVALEDWGAVSGMRAGREDGGISREVGTGTVVRMNAGVATQMRAEGRGGVGPWRVAGEPRDENQGTAAHPVGPFWICPRKES